MTPDEILGHRPRLLSRAQREFFFANGYLLVERALDEAWLSRLRKAFATLEKEGEATREIHSDALRLKLLPDWDAYEGVHIDNLYQRPDG